MPNVVGKTLAAAQKALKVKHCRLGHVTRAASARKRNRVISQKPRPGKRLANGAKVSVVVSKGRG